MHEHDAKLWLRTTKILMRQIALVNATPEGKIDLPSVLKCLEMVENQCGEVGLDVAATMARESRFAIGAVQDAGNKAVLGELEALHSAIEGELKSILFLRVRSEFTKYYKDDQPFGPDVADKFPSSIKDIEEGSKALACGLGTATVFHMMRIMEVGLKALAAALGISYAPSWEAYIRQIDARITAKHKTKGIKWKRDEPYFRDVLGDLQAVKIAWRNPTMHIVRQYDQEEAEDVYRTVKRFMIRLSERFPERSRPRKRPS